MVISSFLTVSPQVKSYLIFIYTVLKLSILYSIPGRNTTQDLIGPFTILPGLKKAVILVMIYIKILKDPDEDPVDSLIIIIIIIIIIITTK